MTSEWIHYFGYGSLVNRDTRPPDEPSICARLDGWKRVWGHRVQRSGEHAGCTSLSVLPANGAIDGVVVRMPAANLPMLDEREQGYQRLAIPRQQFDLDGEIDANIVYMYQSAPENRGLATRANPILLSYVDCVMAGYEKLFGEQGLTDFLHSTDGWSGAIENDRQAPRYPRAVKLTEDVHKRFDQSLYNVVHGNK